MPPGPPVDLAVVERMTESLRISWMNPGFTGFATIASFRVEISGGGIEEFDGDESVSEYTLTSLIPLTHYTISLYVVNDAGFESEPAVVQESTLSLSKHAPNPIS